jgi:hypothetical protein
VVVAQGRAARLERRAGKVGVRRELAVARPVLVAAQLERPEVQPEPGAHREPLALKHGDVAVVGGIGSPPGRRSLQTRKGNGRVGRGAAIEAWGAPSGAASPGEVAHLIDASAGLVTRPL